MKKISFAEAAVLCADAAVLALAEGDKEAFVALMTSAAQYLQAARAIEEMRTAGRSE